MSKQDILDYFSDINHAYNDSTRLNTLSRMLDGLVEQANSPWHRVEEELPKDDCEVFTASRLPFDKTDTWIYDHSFFTTDVSECEELKDEYPNEHKAAFYKWSDISDKYVICHYGLKYWMLPIEPPKEDE